MPYATEAAHAWNDPEFWGPPGRGCARCHERRPIVRDAGFGGALCDACLGRCFPERPFEWMVEWLGQERERQVRQERRAEALKAALRNDLQKALRYERDYGIWLPAWRAHP